LPFTIRLILASFGLWIISQIASSTLKNCFGQDAVDHIKFALVDGEGSPETHQEAKGKLGAECSTSAQPKKTAATATTTPTTTTTTTNGNASRRP
jgi:hypothetical protein